MDYLSLSITKLHELLIKGEISPLDLVKLAIEKAKADNNNAFEYISEKEALEAVNNLDPNKKENLLWGIPFVLKDNFSTKGIPTTASSNMLNGYIPNFSSEVYLRLIEQGAILIGKSTLDELAMAGTGTTGHLGYTYNPWDPSHKHQIGGSSCGSAASCAAGIVPFAIGSDTGDSVRKPASFSNLVGFKPTWGRISRFGLFPFAPSLDHVAFFTRNVKDSAIVLSALAGHDKKDSTSSRMPTEDYVQTIRDIQGFNIAVIKEIYDCISDKTIRSSFENVLMKLQEKGANIKYVHMDINLCKAIYPTYIIISSAEATSSNANLDGIKFGPRSDGDTYEEVMFNTRTKGFSQLIKRRFVIGSYSLLRENQKDIFIRAQKCRRLIVDAVNNILKDNDVIYLPATVNAAPLFEENKMDKLNSEYNIADNYLALANLGGQPSLVLPLGFKDGLPFGGNLTGRIFDETKVLSVALAIEEIVGFNDLIAGEKK